MNADAGHERNEFRSTDIDRPDFVSFDESRAVRIYRRNLPHWRQDEAMYFVTFRLVDSIPQNVLREWDYERETWLTARGIVCGGTANWKQQLPKLSQSDQLQFRKYFNRLFHMELDQCRGECFLNAPACLAAIRSKLFEGDGNAYHLGDFVIMPNHVHLLLTPNPGEELEAILKRIKGSTARSCNQALQRTGAFWQADSYDHIVRDLEELAQIRQYIASNPEKAGINVPFKALYRATWIDGWFSL